ncbi:hypothetical protein PVAP13_7KG165910 [Panicum virgatum]|uniref:Uncharacterized protein n=1 Tax=Panicum virgatum TaxID=38727 RepID=A0A8T0QMX6_PANVG|nr:hypothetical protein PVAP13_7KG165910 [Panicum virgatum]
MGNKLKKVYCEETTPQSTCASSVLFGFTLESMETYDEKTPAEIRREKDKKRYAAMSWRWTHRIIIIGIGDRRQIVMTSESPSSFELILMLFGEQLRHAYLGYCTTCCASK